MPLIFSSSLGILQVKKRGMRLFRWLRRKRDEEPLRLRVDGVGDAPFTQEPDEAEVAAHALLESLSGRKPIHKANADSEKPERGTKEYYDALADRIRKAHDAATLRTMRFVSFCEQELRKPDLPKDGPGSLALLESELYKRIDTIEREGGELEKRWQHCLAEVTVRLMGVVDSE